MSALTGIEIGAELPTQTFQLDRVMLSNYAKASGDLNPIHLDEDLKSNLEVSGKIAEITDGKIRVDLTVISNEQKVLGMTRAFVVKV